MPQVNYNWPSGVAIAGAPADTRSAELARVDSYINPALKAAKDVTVGGTESAGVYSFSVDGYLVAFDRQGAETNAQIATALYVAARAIPELLADYRITNPSAGVVLFTKKAPSEDFELLAVNEPGSGTLTPSTITDVADEVRVGAGLGVKVGGNPGELALPSGGETAADFIGVTRHNHAGVAENTGRAVDEDGFEPGSVIGVQDNEGIWVQVAEAVALTDTPNWVVSGADAGKFAAAGGTALSGWAFRTATSGPGLAKLRKAS